MLLLPYLDPSPIASCATPQTFPAVSVGFSVSSLPQTMPVRPNPIYQIICTQGQRNLIFQTYSAFPAITLMRLREIKTIATWYENQPFTKSIVDGALDAATFNKINITGQFVTKANPSYDEVLQVAKAMKELNPDAIIGGTYYTSCKPFIQALRAINWTPKAYFSSLCTASRPESPIELKGDERYIIDYLEWDHRLAGPDYVDDTGYFLPVNDTTPPAPKQFYDLHERRWGEPPFHFTALAFSLGTVVHKLLQTTGRVDQELWRQTLNSFLITSYSGKISFDGWGYANSTRRALLRPLILVFLAAKILLAMLSWSSVTSTPRSKYCTP